MSLDVHPGGHGGVGANLALTVGFRFTFWKHNGTIHGTPGVRLVFIDCALLSFSPALADNLSIAQDIDCLVGCESAIEVNLSEGLHEILCVIRRFRATH